MSVFPEHWKNINILSELRLPPRNAFLPYSTKERCRFAGMDRGESDRITLLNGSFEFQYHPSSTHIQPEDIAAADWNTVEVPSIWQAYGYEPWHYVNHRYPFPAIPPHVPTYNPLGIYRRKFTYEVGLEFKNILCFQGVDSSFCVYLNNQYVGYSEGSHLTAEFDITEHLSDGENLLTVIVYKWCSGSYLEDQDKFRTSGIFRDIYIIRTPSEGIWDIKIDYQPENTQLTVWNMTCTIHNINKKPNVQYKLEFMEQTHLIYGTSVETTISMTVENPLLWTAETPNCYTLFITVLSESKVLECIRQTVGFRQISIQNSVFLLNGMPIKLKGVNRHDTHPVKGPAVSLADMERDITLMKEYNVNCVRCSHYPNDPLFYELCNVHGLYVIDETDLECHGAGHMAEGFNCIANDPVWQPAFLDRLQRMILRDRNHPCILMWSLGNESGIGQNHDAMAEYTRNVTPHIPVHYEGAAASDRLGYDVVSRMYSSLEQIEQEGKNESKDTRPFFLCEYNHAMGTGPGNFREYMGLFYKYPRILGGCVWELVDHAVDIGDNVYRYGGDFGEYPHDGNFCVDGLFYPDRTPSTSALEMKQAYRPVTSTLKDGQLHLTNRYDFNDTTGICFEWQITLDGKHATNGKWELDIPPHETVIIPCPNVEGDGIQHITITYRNANSEYSYGHDQFCLGGTAILPRFVPSLPDYACSADKTVLTGKDFSITFSHITYTLSSICYQGREYLNQKPDNSGNGMFSFSPPVSGPRIQLWRAPTDNDMYIKQEWIANGYDKLWTTVEKFEEGAGNDGYRFTVSGILAPPYLSGMFRFENRFTVCGEGVIKVTSNLQPMRSGLPYLPRFGIRLETVPELSTVSWFGRGKHENYSDMLDSSIFGIHCLSLDEMNPLNIKPQECGNRSEVFWCELSDDSGKGLKIFSEKPVNIHVSPYSTEQLTALAHRDMLKSEGMIQLSIDDSVSGLGSNSCGHLPLENYRVLSSVEHSLSFYISFNK